MRTRSCSVVGCSSICLIFGPSESDVETAVTPQSSDADVPTSAPRWARLIAALLQLGTPATDTPGTKPTATTPAEPDRDDPDGPIPGSGRPDIETVPVGDPSDPRKTERELVPA